MALPCIARPQIANRSSKTLCIRVNDGLIKQCKSFFSDPDVIVEFMPSLRSAVAQAMSSCDAARDHAACESSDMPGISEIQSVVQSTPSRTQHRVAKAHARARRVERHNTFLQRTCKPVGSCAALDTPPTISLQCSIDTFGWLLRYVRFTCGTMPGSDAPGARAKRAPHTRDIRRAKRCVPTETTLYTRKQSKPHPANTAVQLHRIGPTTPSPPTLTPRNAIPILLAANHLCMGTLLHVVVRYVRDHLIDVLTSGIDARCIGGDLIGQLAAVLHECDVARALYQLCTRHDEQYQPNRLFLITLIRHLALARLTRTTVPEQEQQQQRYHHAHSRKKCSPSTSLNYCVSDSFVPDPSRDAMSCDNGLRWCSLCGALYDMTLANRLASTKGSSATDSQSCLTTPQLQCPAVMAVHLGSSSSVRTKMKMKEKRQECAVVLCLGPRGECLRGHSSFLGDVARPSVPPMATLLLSHNENSAGSADSHSVASPSSRLQVRHVERWAWRVVGSLLALQCTRCRCVVALSDAWLHISVCPGLTRRGRADLRTRMMHDDATHTNSHDHRESNRGMRNSGNDVRESLGFVLWPSEAHDNLRARSEVNSLGYQARSAAVSLEDGASMLLQWFDYVAHRRIYCDEAGSPECHHHGNLSETSNKSGACGVAMPACACNANVKCNLHQRRPRCGSIVDGHGNRSCQGGLTPLTRDNAEWVSVHGRECGISISSHLTAIRMTSLIGDAERDEAKSRRNVDVCTDASRNDCVCEDSDCCSDYSSDGGSATSGDAACEARSSLSENDSCVHASASTTTDEDFLVSCVNGARDSTTLEAASSVCGARRHPLRCSEGCKTTSVLGLLDDTSHVPACGWDAHPQWIRQWRHNSCAGDDLQQYYERHLHHEIGCHELVGARGVWRTTPSISSSHDSTESDTNEEQPATRAMHE